MITGHFTIALGTLAVLALVGRNPATWTATLEGKDGSTISGTARVEAPTPPAPAPRDTTMPPRDTTPPPMPEPAKEPVDNQVRATLSISNAPPNATLSWHVHQGKCGSNGPIVGSSAAYQPVKVDARGSGTATASVTASLTEKGEYYADVHASQDQGGQVAACGTLEYQRTRADDL